MSKRLIIWLFPFLIASFTDGKSQDIHFSQLEFVPLLNNPAYTGHMNADWRLMNTYRSQWRRLANPFNTLNFNFDKRIYLLNETAGFGLLFLNDQAGSKSLVTNQFLLSGAVHKFIGQNHFLLGLQAGYIYRYLDDANLSFPQQYNAFSGYFDAITGSGESGVNERDGFPDLNIGLVWRRKIREIMPEAGFSVHHLNTPASGFIGPDNWPSLPVRYTFHANTYIPLRSVLSAMPQVKFVNYGKSHELMAGNILIIQTAGMVSVLPLNQTTFGTYIRSNFIYNFDAVALNAGFHFRYFSLGVNYDISVSGLRKVSGFVGAFEISLVYRGLKREESGTVIPCTIL